MKEKKSSYFTATWKMLAAVIIGGIAGGVSVVIYELMKKGIDAQESERLTERFSNIYFQL